MLFQPKKESDEFSLKQIQLLIGWLYPLRFKKLNMGNYSYNGIEIYNGFNQVFVFLTKIS